LGSKFLRHIARTTLLLHCISLESADPWDDYKTVRAEISAFEGGILVQKPEIIVLTKSDTREKADIGRIEQVFKDKGMRTYMVSILEDASVKAFGDGLIALLRDR
jgi:GTP-binding protein